MTNLEWLKTLSAKELSDLLYDYWLPRGQYVWTDSRKGLMKVLGEKYLERDCDQCKHQDNCYCVKGLGCPFEPKDEPQTCSVNGRPYDCGKCEYFRCTADEPQTYITENRDTQILDAWQVHNRSTTSVGIDPSSEESCETCRYEVIEDDYDLYDMCEPMVEGECRYEPRTMYYPQVDGITPSVIVKTEPQLTTKCLNCANSGSYKCRKCDGEMYFKDDPQTDCGWK